MDFSILWKPSVCGEIRGNQLRKMGKEMSGISERNQPQQAEKVENRRNFVGPKISTRPCSATEKFDSAVEKSCPVPRSVAEIFVCRSAKMYYYAFESKVSTTARNVSPYAS